MSHCTCFYMGKADVRPDHSPSCMLKSPPMATCGPAPSVGASKERSDTELQRVYSLVDHWFGESRRLELQVTQNNAVIERQRATIEFVSKQIHSVTPDWNAVFRWLDDSLALDGNKPNAERRG